MHLIMREIKISYFTFKTFNFNTDLASSIFLQGVGTFLVGDSSNVL